MTIVDSRFLKTRIINGQALYHPTGQASRDAPISENQPIHKPKTTNKAANAESPKAKIPDSEEAQDPESDDESMSEAELSNVNEKPTGLSPTFQKQILTLKTILEKHTTPTTSKVQSWDRIYELSP